MQNKKRKVKKIVILAGIVDRIELVYENIFKGNWRYFFNEK